MKRVDEIDILIVGSLCGNDISFYEYLSRHGMRAKVARRFDDNSLKEDNIPQLKYEYYDDNAVIKYRTRFELIKLLQKTKLVASFSSSLGCELSYLWVFRKLLGLPPVINMPTGSDLLEVVNENTLTGFRYRYFMKTCDLNFVTGAPGYMDSIFNNKIKNFSFYRYPYYIPEYDEIGDATFSSSRLRFFHPSHIDFKEVDNSEYRKSSKGNDRFFKAFIRALDNGLDAECVLLSRGADVGPAREIINASKHRDRFIWKNELSRQELVREIIQSDLIIDQFDIGIMGGITVEAMALQRPVMIYLSKKTMDMVYPVPPQMLIAHSEEEIFQELMNNSDRKKLKRIGINGRKWLLDNHGYERCLKQFLFHYSVLTGEKIPNLW